jgi:hypothetical protein
MGYVHGGMGVGPATSRVKVPSGLAMRAPLGQCRALGLLGHTFVILCDNCAWLVCVPPGLVR